MQYTPPKDFDELVDRYLTKMREKRPETTREQAESVAMRVLSFARGIYTGAVSVEE